MLRKPALPELLDDASEDEVVVDWTDESLGNVLKKYTRKYINDQTDHQPSVKDLENPIFGKGQKKIFEKAQWNNLKKKWLVKNEELNVSDEMMDIIKQTSKIAGRNIDHGIDQARTLYKRTMITRDNRNFNCFTHKMFEIVERHPELFDDQKKKKLTENDYVVRLWAPFLFALFDDGCPYFTPTAYQLHVEHFEMTERLSKKNTGKVDLRVNFNTKEKKYDLFVAEFAKNSNLGKLRSDHVKLLLEGNALISSLKKYHLKTELALLQGAVAATDKAHANSFDKAWRSITSSQELQN
ncbi:hypothetical protein BDA99DRAFT_565355 [Phascolomyces articulosus]|uniref:Uncharacterized protein n=1 Tax=Phascolomyces articulosus TaxID=60185 RepID=A0AAD5JN97_9FUNG|nr:hypothetical protein BDA99DRAFT_565355 [Phascolomyces articulosus]